MALDGIDFSPLLDGQPLNRSKPLVWAYYNAINDARVAMRDGKWKVLAKLNGGQLNKMTNVTTETFPLIRDAKLTDVEVYEITSDIHEDNDLATSQPDLARRLGDKLRDRIPRVSQRLAHLVVGCAHTSALYVRLSSLTSARRVSLERLTYGSAWKG